MHRTKKTRQSAPSPAVDGVSPFADMGPQVDTGRLSLILHKASENNGRLLKALEICGGSLCGTLPYMPGGSEQGGMIPDARPRILEFAAICFLLNLDPKSEISRIASDSIRRIDAGIAESAVEGINLIPEDRHLYVSTLAYLGANDPFVFPQKSLLRAAEGLIEMSGRNGRRAVSGAPIIVVTENGWLQTCPGASQTRINPKHVQPPFPPALIEGVGRLMQFSYDPKVRSLGNRIMHPRFRAQDEVSELGIYVPIRPGCSILVSSSPVEGREPVWPESGHVITDAQTFPFVKPLGSPHALECKDGRFVFTASYASEDDAFLLGSEPMVHTDGLDSRFQHRTVAILGSLLGSALRETVYETICNMSIMMENSVAPEDDPRFKRPEAYLDIDRIADLYADTGHIALLARPTLSAAMFMMMGLESRLVPGAIYPLFGKFKKKPIDHVWSEFRIPGTDRWGVFDPDNGAVLSHRVFTRPMIYMAPGVLPAEAVPVDISILGQKPQLS